MEKSLEEQLEVYFSSSAFKTLSGVLPDEQKPETIVSQKKKKSLQNDLALPLYKWFQKESPEFVISPSGRQSLIGECFWQHPQVSFATKEEKHDQRFLFQIFLWTVFGALHVTTAFVDQNKLVFWKCSRWIPPEKECHAQLKKDRLNSTRSALRQESVPEMVNGQPLCMEWAKELQFDYL